MPESIRTGPTDQQQVGADYHAPVNDSALIRIIHDVGLGDDLRWRGTAIGFMWGLLADPAAVPGLSPVDAAA